MKTNKNTTKNDTSSVIEKVRLHESDTGSPSVQIVKLSEKISALAEHLKLHKKDNSSRRGLLKMVGQRRRLIEYLKKTDSKLHSKVVKELGL